MPETGVKTPIGKVSKGSLFIGGLAAVAVAGYMYIKHKSAAATTATPAAGTGAYGYGAYGYGGVGGDGRGGVRRDGRVRRVRVWRDGRVVATGPAGWAGTEWA